MKIKAIVILTAFLCFILSGCNRFSGIQDNCQMLENKKPEKCKNLIVPKGISKGEEKNKKGGVVFRFLTSLFSSKSTPIQTRKKYSLTSFKIGDEHGRIVLNRTKYSYTPTQNDSNQLLGKLSIKLFGEAHTIFDKFTLSDIHLLLDEPVKKKLYLELCKSQPIDKESLNKLVAGSCNNRHLINIMEKLDYLQYNPELECEVHLFDVRHLESDNGDSLVLPIFLEMCAISKNKKNDFYFRNKGVTLLFNRLKTRVLKQKKRWKYEKQKYNSPEYEIFIQTLWDDFLEYFEIIKNKRKEMQQSLKYLDSFIKNSEIKLKPKSKYRITNAEYTELTYKYSFNNMYYFREDSDCLAKLFSIGWSFMVDFGLGLDLVQTAIEGKKDMAVVLIGFFHLKHLLLVFSKVKEASLIGKKADKQLKNKLSNNNLLVQKN